MLNKLLIITALSACMLNASAQTDDEYYLVNKWGDWDRGVAPAAGAAPKPAPPPPQANAPAPPPVPPASAQPAPAPQIAQVTNIVSGAPAATPPAGTPIATGTPPTPSRPPSRRR